jgi:hypothetical protein
MRRTLKLAPFALLLGAGLFGTATEARAQWYWDTPRFQPRAYSADAERKIDNWYRQYLGRRPDPTGVVGWTDMFRRGAPDEEVLGGILGSDEYFQRKGGSNREWVRGVYEDLLRRAPTRDEMRNAMDQLIDERDRPRRADRSRSAFARALLESINRPEPSGYDRYDR